MKITMCLAVVSVVCLAGPVKAQATTPPAPSSDCVIPENLLNGAGLYLGEMHGTQESPDLALCLVKDALARRDGPVVVSLELPADAGDAQSLFWNGTDGRSSLAMQGLVVQLMVMTAIEPRLSVDFHAECPMSEMPTDFNAFVNECYGRNLVASAAKGYLIALSGNVHALRTLPAYVGGTYKPAGGYLPANVRTVDIVTVDDGSFWGCQDNGCGVHVLKGSHDLAGLSGFQPDTARGYDYLYVLQTSTASPPAAAP